MNVTKDAMDTDVDPVTTTQRHKPPLVSVLMNCYNSSQYLQEAIDSVIAQTYTEWELIFWDNQSTDESATIFKSYTDPRLKYFYAPEYTTLGAARNLAIQEISGEWCGILDCDDIWMPQKLEHQLLTRPLEQNTGIIYSDYHIIGNDGVIKDAGIKPTKSFQGYVFDEVFAEEFTVCLPTVLFNTAALRRTGSFASYKVLEDFDLLLRLAEKYRFVFINEKLASYRVHSGQASTKYHLMLSEKLEILGKWESAWKKDKQLSSEKVTLLSKAKGKAYLIAGTNAVFYGDSGIKYYATSLKQQFSIIGFAGFTFSLFGHRFAASAISYIRKILGHSQYY